MYDSWAGGADSFIGRKDAFLPYFLFPDDENEKVNSWSSSSHSGAGREFRNGRNPVQNNNLGGSYSSEAIDCLSNPILTTSKFIKQKG